MHNPLVSVIIPTFGRPHRLPLAIRSVLNQTYKNIEIIVSDDNPPTSNSREETESLMRESFNLDGVKYVRMPKNGGGSLARNFGISFALGEFISFLDDDDEYFPTKIEQQVKQCINERVDISLCGMQAVKNGTYVKMAYDLPRGRSLKEFIVFGNCYTPMIMIRKELVNEVGGFFDTPRFQDHIFMLRLLEKKPCVGILNDKLYAHNIHSDERITYSKKSRDGFIIRHEHENKNIYLLSDTEVKALRARQYLSLLDLDINSSSAKPYGMLLCLPFKARNLHECVKYTSYAVKNFIRRIIN